jgi:RNA polymerase sigma-70 factor (ECF subfamily)
MMVAQVAEIRALVGAPLATPEGRRTELITALFKHHRRSLLWYLARLVPTRADAEEIAQEAFVRLLRAPQLEADPTRARNYLFATATNLARDDYRRRSARAEGNHVPLDEQQLTADDPQPERLVDAARTRRVVESVLRELRPRPRQAFLKYMYEELTCERIALELGVCKKTIESDISLTLNLCRSRLSRDLSNLFAMVAMNVAIVA